MGAIKRKDTHPPKAGSSDHDSPRTLGLAERAATALPATFTARLVALDEHGKAWILAEDEGTVHESPSPGRVLPSPTTMAPRPARSTVHLTPEHVGREVLACRANRVGEPVIVGLLIDPMGVETGEEPAIDLVVERRRIVLAAKTEVVLRCGEGSITLAADGKVTIRGVDVVSTAARTQRIRGGAVRIN